MSKRSSREREQVAWEIYRAKAKLAERKKLIEVNRYLKQDEEQLEELMSSGIV